MSANHGNGTPILVTGVAGFIGMALAEHLLARGDAVIGIDNLNDYYSVELKERRLQRLQALGGDRFEFVKLDFSDMGALNAALGAKPFDRIVHLGAQAGVRYSLDNPHAYVQSNLVGHLNILELGRHRGSSHIVDASSSSVYGGNESIPFKASDRVDHLMSLYAAMKKSDELMSETYAHLFRLPLTGLRFFTVYGPWGRPDMAMWLFTDAILAGRPINVFNGGKMHCEFKFIDDIVARVIASLENPPIDDGSAKAGGSVAPHRIYNIENHRAEELGLLIELIEQSCGQTAKKNMLPMQPGDVPETFADIAAIQDELGYAPTTRITDGAQHFFDRYREYHGNR